MNTGDLFRLGGRLYEYRGASWYSTINGYDGGPHVFRKELDDCTVESLSRPFKCSMDELIDLLINRNFDGYTELVSEREHCKWTLRRIVGNLAPKGFVLMECAMFGSSSFGDRTVIPYGGNATLQEIPTRPMSPKGLASDMAVTMACSKF